MSYTTNSTANRLKFNKGWKNPSFPEILPLYSRDNVFFFKLYLFLKAYFTLNRTKLLFCDLRTSENYTKLLYLVINSLPKKLKKKKSFKRFNVRRRTSGFQHSKLRNANFRYAVNLLYLNLPKLKKQISANILPLSKQKVNPIFYKKTRYNTWINYLTKIQNVRKTIKIQTIPFVPMANSKLNLEQSYKFKLRRLKNEIIVLNKFFATVPVSKEIVILYKTKLKILKKKFKKLSTSLLKYEELDLDNNLVKQDEFFNEDIEEVQLDNVIMNFDEKNRHFKFVSSDRFSQKSLKKKLFTTNELMKSNQKISIGNYQDWLNRSLITQLKKTQFDLNLKQQRTSRRKSKLINIIRINDEKNSIILNDNVYKKFLSRTINAYISFLKQNNELNTQKSFIKFFNLIKAQQYIFGHHIYNTSIRYAAQKYSIYCNSKKMTILSPYQNVFNHLQSILGLNYPTYLGKTNVINFRRKRRKKSKFRFNLIKKLRKKSQIVNDTRTFSTFQLNSAVNLEKMSDLIKNFEENYKEISKRVKEKPNVWQIRESFRKNYKKHVTLLTKYQYKLRLQELLRHYFKMNFEIKVVRPLVQFKNLKFLRLIHPLYRHYNPNPQSNATYKSTLRKFKIKSSTIIPLRNRYICMTDSTKRFSSNPTYTKRNTYVFKKLKDKFQHQRKKELLEFTQSRLKDIRRKIMIRNFMPIASLCIKYLNPQLLADFIAKEFERTKHHQAIIYGLANALKSLPFTRAKGYRIAIVGRINSSDKSRSFLINRNVFSRQNFSSKINFASTQARARIGSFGIKVWIFY